MHLLCLAAMLVVLFNNFSVLQRGPSYMRFVVNSTEFPSQDYHGCAIVGSSTTGYTFTQSLPQSYRVLLLELGGVPYGGKPKLMTRGGLLSTLTEVDEYDSPAQAFLSEDGVHTGGILGGSRAINAGFYSLADPDFCLKSDVDWDLALDNQSYEWVEKEIVFRPELRNWQSAVRDGLLEAGVDPFHGFTLDHRVETKIVGSTFDGAGRRHSSADLLNNANAANIKVAVYANVERVLVASTAQLAGPRQTTIGVVYWDRNGKYHHAMVRPNGEVLLSAGAIGSPQLLLLSGIGPRPYLSSWGIPVAYHLPYVGQYLYDNPRNGISIVPPMPPEQSLIQVVGITKVGAYLEAASNVVPFSTPPRSVFIRTPSPPLYITVATLMEKISGPMVRFSYFSDPVNVEKCVNGTRKIGEILRTRSMRYFMFREWFGSSRFRFVGPPLPDDQIGLLSDGKVLQAHCHHYMASPRWLCCGVIGSPRVVDGSTFAISPAN
ncbi:hypothetical protein Tsubulata_032425 [Turnera subulata]|uniref:Glucose-methanol-choline oxidoreductase N-terminal domain-containing protein n=1 Tax=Turnera subulata TaxID=218843 RepID=A0A9Q0F3H5_9ROSI|nr:hypothetical protein Tsubulata_032425 [Turnera subulata]